MKTRRFNPAVVWLALVAFASNLLTSAANAQAFTTIKSFGILTNVTGFEPQCQLVQGSDGTLYGTAYEGEGNVNGTIFRVQPDGSGFTVLKWLTNSVEGANPQAGVTLSGSVLYGTTESGGSSNYGIVFQVKTDGTDYTVLKHFTGGDGANPSGGLTLSGSVLYGTTRYGGSSNYGTVFKLNTDGTGYTVLKHFPYFVDGGYPQGALTLTGSVLYGTTLAGAGSVFRMNADGTDFTVLRFFGQNEGVSPRGGLTLSDGVLYGTTEQGGSSGSGTVFKMNTDGTDFMVLKHFSATSPDYPYLNTDGAWPQALTSSGSTLYGTTYYGGSSGRGTVFKLNTDGSGFNVLKHFTGSDGAWPDAGLLLASGVLYGTTRYGGSSDIGTLYSGYGTVFKVNTAGTGYAVLKHFTPSDGANPYASIVLSDGTLYGTTYSGGSSGQGTVFKVNSDGAGYAVLKHFTYGDGANPYAGLTLSGSTLYGTTYYGGSSPDGDGTVFKVNTNGTGYMVFKNFTYIGEAALPYGGLTLSGSTLYGTTTAGGPSAPFFGNVFKIGTGGTGYTALKYFGDLPDDGWYAYASVVLSGGALYGTTLSGGSSGNGTVFKLNTDGTGYTVLKHFTGFPSDGASPSASLTLSSSMLYGTTEEGGSNNVGTVFKLNRDGTGYAVLKHFGGSDGARPRAGLTLSGSALYGTTQYGGNWGYGTVFQMNTNGTGYTVLKHFTGSDGANPFASLTLFGSTLYGTTGYGGSLDLGTVFKLDLLIPSSIPLTIQSLGNAVVLSWTNSAFALQAAPTVAGVFTNIPGATSPHTNALSGTQRYFRLRGN